MSANRPFCVYCGNTRLQGHARDCVRAVATPQELERLQSPRMPGKRTLVNDIAQRQADVRRRLGS